MTIKERDSKNRKNHIIENYEVNYKATQTVSFKNPILWSDKRPYLYTLKSEIEYNGKILDDAVTEIGIRKIDFVPEQDSLSTALKQS